LLLKSGQLTIENENGSATVQAGSWAFPREGPRLQHFSDDAAVFSVHFMLYWPGNQPLFHCDTAIVLASTAWPQLEKQTRILCRQVERLFPGVANQLPWTRGTLRNHLDIQRVFASWLCVYVDALLASGATPSRLGQVDERVLQAAMILDRLPMSVTFDESWLAAEVRLSPSQLDRLFTRQFGQTPRGYFERLKLGHAADLVRNAPMSIKQIAYQTGFRSLPYFSRWFRAKTGMSPRAFKTSGVYF
jgi:AraC-like DNA-binding protein